MEGDTFHIIHSVHMSMAHNDISHGTFKLWVNEVHVLLMSTKECNEIGCECQIDGRTFMKIVKGNITE